jgi:hypothetical protein
MYGQVVLEKNQNRYGISAYTGNLKKRDTSLEKTLVFTFLR